MDPERKDEAGSARSGETEDPIAAGQNSQFEDQVQVLVCVVNVVDFDHVWMLELLQYEHLVL